MRKQAMSGLGYAGLMMILASLSCLMGCGGGDDDSPATTTTVVTNVVNGVIQTNVVVVTNAPAADPVAPAAAVLDVSGEWNGPLIPEAGESGHLELDLDQNGNAVIGQFFMTPDGIHGQVGTVNGVLNGAHLVLTLTVNGVPTQMTLDGQVNAAATAYTGTWDFTGGDSGTFALQK